MYIKNKTASAAFKAAIFLGSLAGILIQCGVFTGGADLGVLRYYTLISNVLCCLYFGAASVQAARGKGIFLPRFKPVLIMGITVTGLVYHFMLSDSTFSMGGAMAAANLLLHYFTPCAAVLDWLLFDEKGRYTALSPLSWVLLPDIYFVLATVYGFAGGKPFYGGSRFPYFFMDFDALGVGRVLLYVIVLNVIFAALGYVYFGLDRLLYRLKKGRKPAGEAER